MSEITSKKRGQRDHNGSRVSSLADLSNRGRVISGRVGSKSKRVASNRGDLFTQGDDDANTSIGEDGIDFDTNRNTIMSNFEEWIKMSTDNKITSKNSWQFALIDYFHDLNVIKDGDNINFQRASATLDGCVKIYLSRVESVATETGKLLSGLATKNNNHPDDQDDEPLDGEEDNDVDQVSGEDSRRKRKINRVLESTLVDFDTIRVKKLDQELAIDPLFKKALAEFDEGGAKSLLLNTLSIDKNGRVVFDATTNSRVKEEDKQVQDHEDNTNVNLEKLLTMILGSETDDKIQLPLDEMAICPSMDQLKVVVNDINQAKTVLGDVNNKYLYDNDNEGSTTKVEEQEFDFGDYDDNNFANDDGNDFNDSQSIQQHDEAQPDYEYEVEANKKILDQDLMAYFDETMKSNWRGPEHWKVTAYKKSKKIAESNNDNNNEVKSETNDKTKTKPRKKEGTIINFMEDEDEEQEIEHEDKLFDTVKNSNITKKLEENITLLPPDIQYNSTRLINLFLKPNNPISQYIKIPKKPGNPLTDENFFADQYNEQDRMTSFHQAQFDEINQDYEQEEDGDVFGGIDFNDELQGHNEGETEKEGDNKLIGNRRARPEYVNFSRIAKRVNVKLLKDNLWRGIKEEDEEKENEEEKQKEKEEKEKEKEEEQNKEKEPSTEKTFTQVVESISKMYSPEEKKDLSTSFCFICLLHLANEHSLTVDSTERYDDLRIGGF